MEALSCHVSQPNPHIWQEPEPLAEALQSLSLDHTLERFFEAYVLPICLPYAASRNVKQYRETLGYWKRFSGDPTLGQLGHAVEKEQRSGFKTRQYANARVAISRFINGLKQLPGRDGVLAENTVRKHCVAIQFILDRAAPPDARHNPDGAGMLPEAIAIPKPSLVINDVEDVFTLPEIGHWLDACHHAKAPRKVPGVKPPDFWRSLVAFVYNVGLRIETVVLLRFEWFHTDEHGHWVRIPPRSIKKKRGRDFYVNKWAWGAMEEIRTRRELVFPWAHDMSWLHEWRRRLLAKSEVKPERRFGFHGLRKACLTQSAMINPMAASMIAGHSSGRNVTRDHYIHKRVMVDTLDRLPQPAWHRDRDGAQLRLF